MSLFYRDGRLHIGPMESAVDLLSLARQVDGPFYAYDLDQILSRVEHLKSALGQSRFTIHYAMKANANELILKALAKTGTGVDVVSGGEIERALKAGFPPERIIFSGVGKTRNEITFAITQGIKQINIESLQELERVASIAEELKKETSIAFRINPDVCPETHPYITTGFRDNKFGLDESDLPDLLNILIKRGTYLRLRGLTLHIGSQLLELASLREAIEKTIPIYKRLLGLGYGLDRFDIGGGIGLRYESDDETMELGLIPDYGQIIHDLLSPLGCEVLLEPGRFLVGRAGVLVGEVQYLKETKHKKFLILNTGMHHLMRPMLYDAYHRILPVVRREHESPVHVYDVVGPICESSDFIARERELPEINSGDLLAIADTGAYGFSMASTYNSHDLPLEFVIEQGYPKKS